MKGKGLSPAVKQLEEEQSLMSWDLICVVNDKHIVCPGSYHSGHAIPGQESPQVVISDPAVLPSTLWEMVEKYIDDLVADVVVGTIQQESQEAGENTNSGC